MHSKWLGAVSVLAIVNFATPPFAQEAAAPAAAAAGDPVAAEPAAPDAVTLAAQAKAAEKQKKELKRLYGAGPYPDEIDSFVNARPEELRPYYRALYTGGERNSVLNFERLGLAAMETGHWANAEQAFDAALLRIEAVYAKDAQADAARSLWHKESNKDWKGEPYERAMAYYYRGLLYLRKGDYNNARASFKGAEFQDTISESEEFQGDFALMNFLTGWSSRCAGDSGTDDFEAAAKVQPELVPPQAGDNLILIAELGHGPFKERDGKQKEKVVFKPAEGFPEIGAVFTLTPTSGSPTNANVHIASSVYYQATTRGGRAMDGVMNGKANWKSTTEAIGSGTTQAGLQMMGGGYGNSAYAGAAVALAGLLFSGLSTAMKTDADIRQWDTLPDGVELSTIAFNGPFVASVAYSDVNGPMELPSTPLMQATSGKCSIVWGRSRSALAAPETPGDDPKVQASVSKKSDVQVKDKTFRNELDSSSGS